MVIKMKIIKHLDLAIEQLRLASTQDTFILFARHYIAYQAHMAKALELSRQDNG